MAEKRFICDLDLDGNRLLNALLHPSYDAPENPEAGQVYFDIEEKKLFFFGGDVWRTFATPEDIADFNALIKDTQSTVARAFGQDRWSNLSGPLRMNVVSGTLRLTVGGNFVCSVPIGDIIPDALISSATLVTVPEQGITIPVPYIKIVFDSTAGSQVVRFSVKDLIDVYDGSNVKLSDDYEPMEGTPMSGDSVDEAIGKLYTAINDPSRRSDAYICRYDDEDRYADIKSAAQSGKAVFCYKDNNLFTLTDFEYGEEMDFIKFTRIADGKIESVTVDYWDNWNFSEESLADFATREDIDALFGGAEVEGSVLKVTGVVEDTKLILDFGVVEGSRLIL